MISLKIDQSPVRAKLVGQTLVASFRDSTPPTLWQFDLEQNHSFTVALEGEREDWELGVTSDTGSFTSVASFKNREDAQAAFNAVQRVLMEDGAIKFQAPRFSWGMVIGVLLIVFLGFMLFGNRFNNAVLNSAVSLTAPSMGTLPAMAPAAPPVEMRDGVPLPADDVLKMPAPQ